jgi:hypothetical protein
MRQRHSVRSYREIAIPQEVRGQLRAKITEANRESGLHVQLVCDEPKAFSGMRARYGKFTGPNNYFAMVGPKGPALDETVGYEGEKLVLLAQQLGLNTCWVGMTFTKVPSAFEVAHGEKLACVIALGYGNTDGVAHKSKPLAELCNAGADTLEWFLAGMRAAQLAPTAVNQQKFRFDLLSDGRVRATTAAGFFANMDLGIAKLHFELGAGTQNFNWA